MKHVTIGVAGHVDHGKTSFVKQITGIDTDRHPEEKRRGLSLEAGIACWPRQNGTVAAFVDVPGHRDYLKNTVRGLQGVDLAVLVVAADEGIMPQTREHLAILTFFNVGNGIVVLSKTDCVDSETLELAELEIMELTAGTFLEGKPIVPFSAITGQGREEAVDALDHTIAKTNQKTPGSPFRLWIDQVRGFAGVGTVVSGTVLAGAIRVNDELQILPDKISTRVRSIEEHGRKIDKAAAGQRIGLNLHRIVSANIRRGMSLVQPGKYLTASRFNIEMRSIRHPDAPIRDRQKVKLYLGTSVHIATVKFIDAAPEAAGGHSLVQLQLKKPAMVAPGDRFVVSLVNKNIILGGGRVLELAEEKIREANKTRTAKRLAAMLTNDLEGYVEQTCQAHPGKPIDPQRLMVCTIWQSETINQYIASGRDAGKLVCLADGKIVLSREMQRFTALFAEILTEAFRQQPDREPMQVREILHQCHPPCTEDFAFLVAETLCKEGKWDKEKGGFRPASFKRRIPDELSQVAASLLLFAYEQDVRPFSAEYFVRTSTENITLRQVQRTLDFFCKTKEMVRLKNGRYLTFTSIEEIKKKIRIWVDQKGEICLRDCKEALDFNRGLGLPVLEYLDQIGFTARNGEGRIVVGKQIKKSTNH